MGPVALPRRLFGPVKDCSGKIGRGMTQGELFENGPHFGDLAHLFLAERRYTHASARLTDSKPLRFQSPERLTHGHMTGAKFGSDMILAQPRARFQLSGNDPLGQNLADTNGDCVFGWRTHGHGIARSGALCHSIGAPQPRCVPMLTCQPHQHMIFPSPIDLQIAASIAFFDKPVLFQNAA